MKAIVKGFCLLIGLAPLRKSKANGELEIDYFTPFHLIATRNQLISKLNTI